MKKPVLIDVRQTCETFMFCCLKARSRNLKLSLFQFLGLELGCDLDQPKSADDGALLKLNPDHNHSYSISLISFTHHRYTTTHYYYSIQIYYAVLSMSTVDFFCRASSRRSPLWPKIAETPLRRLRACCTPYYLILQKAGFDR